MNNRTNIKSFGSSKRPFASFYTDLEKGEISYAGLGVDQLKFVELYNQNSSRNVVDTAIRRGTGTDEKLKIARKCAIFEGTKKTNVAIRLRAVCGELKEVNLTVAAKNAEIGAKNGKICEQKSDIGRLNRELTASNMENAKLKVRLDDYENLKARVVELESDENRKLMRNQVKMLKNASEDHNSVTGFLYAAINDLNLILKHKNLGKVVTRRNDVTEPAKWIIQGRTHFLNGNEHPALLDAVDEATNGPANNNNDDAMTDIEPENSASQRSNTKRFTYAKFSQNP